MLGRLWNYLFGRHRHSDRVEGADASVTINDTIYRVEDWSEDGMYVSGYKGAEKVGDRFSFQFFLPFTGEDYFEFDAWAEIVRIGNDGIAVKFLHLSEDVLDRIRQIIRLLQAQGEPHTEGNISVD